MNQEHHGRKLGRPETGLLRALNSRQSSLGLALWALGTRREGKEGLLVSRDRSLGSHFLFRNGICLACYFLSMTFGPELSVPVVARYLSDGQGEEKS